MLNNGLIDDIRFLNTVVLLARQYGVEPDWEQSDVEGKYLAFRDQGDIEGFACALGRMFQRYLC